MENFEYKPIIHILMATFQGGTYLKEQLESIESQSYINWRLIISDDGSTDDTLPIISEFAKKVDQPVIILGGPGKGSTRNFFHLINSIEFLTKNELIAFSDQDDVWLPKKLESAVNYFKLIGKSAIPHLYCGRTRIVNASLNPIKQSDMPERNLEFGNALLQNVASGNTMVFNSVLLEILKKIPVDYPIWHDWTAYQIATGCGGLVYYDCNPQVLYRQHNTNVIGASESIGSKLKKLIRILDGSCKEKMTLVEKSMTSVEDHLAPKSIRILKEFKAMRHEPNSFKRLLIAKRNGLYRQKHVDQFVFLLSLFFNRI